MKPLRTRYQASGRRRIFQVRVRKNIAGRNHAGITGLSQPFHKRVYLSGNAAGPDKRRRDVYSKDQHENRKGYERWLNGARNRSMYFHYHGLLTDLCQSDRADASFVTRCTFQSKILQKLDESGRLSRRMLEIDLPFLQDLSLHDIFRISTDYEPSVTTFRRSLHDCAVEIERASGPDEICLLQQRFQERIAYEGLNELRQKLSIWKRRSVQDTALLAVPAVLGAHCHHQPGIIS